MTVHVHKARSRRAQTFLHHQEVSLPSFSFEWNKYLITLPTLCLGIAGYAVLLLILFTLYPSEVRDLVTPGAYLPLFMSFTWGNFFLIAYLSQNLWRGLIYSSVLALLLAGRLYNILPLIVVLVCTVSMIVIDLLLTLKKPKR